MSRMNLRVSACCVALLCVATSRAADEFMRVHVIDVGQANAILVEFPSGVMLVEKDRY